MTGAANPRIELFPQFIAYLEPDASPGEDESSRPATGTPAQAGRHTAVSILSSIGLSLSPGRARWQHVLSVETRVDLEQPQGQVGSHPVLVMAQVQAGELLDPPQPVAQCLVVDKQPRRGGPLGAVGDEEGPLRA